MNKKTIIIGLGQTGLSCVKFLTQKNVSICVVDSRDNPPLRSQCEKEFPDVDLYCGVLPGMNETHNYDVVLSPGIAQDHPFIQPLIQKAAHIMGDIDLFAQYNKLPVIAITGSNGKSTVTTMVGEMARECGHHPAVVGNIGVPVLSLFAEAAEAKKYDFVVMELSSFQLELTHHLKPQVATVLNISPDHLDRYPNYKAYYQAKHKIYNHCQIAVINKNDALAFPKDIRASKHKMFSINLPADNEFGILLEEGRQYLAHGTQKLMLAQDLHLVGLHNIENALAALALGDAVGFDMASMLRALKSYTGLPHRCQIIAKKQNITWINDSKGTNVGATVSALEGLRQTVDQTPAKIILILGGQAKNQEFGELTFSVQSMRCEVIVMGECADELFELFTPHVTTTKCQNINQAVQFSSKIAQSGDIVLFSPACASFDQFKNFEHRGDCFVAAVQELRNTPGHA
jgi:UDP-N-acetylmuramoylalanine--D-glutamate ligase